MNDSGEVRWPPSYRWYAFGAQLAISAVVIAVLYYGVLLPWFSLPLFRPEGGHFLLLLIAGIDIVLGPLLTLVAVGPNKSRRLVRQDLLTTSALRLLALAGGIWLCWESRPAAVIWLDEAFHTLPLSALRQEPRAYEAVTSHHEYKPVYLMIDLPVSPGERSVIFAETYARGTSVLFDASRYRAFDPAHPVVQAAHSRYASRLSRNPGTLALLAAQNIRPDTLGNEMLLLPIASRYETLHLLIDAGTGNILRPVSVPPLTDVTYKR